MTDAPAGLDLCLHCDAPLGGRFCERCRWDSHVATLVLGASHDFYRRMVPSGDPPFPQAGVSGTFELRGEPGELLTLGRARDESRARTDLVLTGAAVDPGVSRRHCELECREAGRWLVRELADTNGVWVNRADRPLGPGRAHLLADGDRIHIGCWSRLTVHLPPSPLPSGAGEP